MKLSQFAAGLATSCITVNAMQPDAKILSSSLAGSWYDANPARLRSKILKWVDEAKLPDGLPDTPPIAVIQPHAGYEYSGPTAAHALKVLKGRKYDTVFILGPSHRIYLRNQICIPKAAGLQTPLGVTETDQSILNNLSRYPFAVTDDQAHYDEHSVQIQLPLLQSVLERGFKIVPVIVGQLDAATIQKIAGVLAKLITPKTLVVISSDFTHFGRAFDYTPFRSDFAENLKKLDLGAFDLIQKKDCSAFQKYIEDTRATICGETPIRLLLQMLPEEAKVSLLHYTTSSANSGDYSHCVSYVSGLVSGNWKQKKQDPNDFLTDADKITLLQMARNSIQYVFTNRKATPDREFSDLANENIRKKMGCFVTLNLNHDLRGCIGEIEAYRPLYEAVTGRAVDAAFRDPRFQQLQPSEFKRIEIEISALTPSHPVSSWKEIIIGKHGMTLTKDGRSAVFLPQVAPEQGWTLEETLTYLARKAGLPPDAWRAEDAKFTVFEAIVFRESDYQ